MTDDRSKVYCLFCDDGTLGFLYWVPGLPGPEFPPGPEFRGYWEAQTTVSPTGPLRMVGAVEPSAWPRNWLVTDNSCPLATGICAECDGPSYSDYLCAKCRT